MSVDDDFIAGSEWFEDNILPQLRKILVYVKRAVDKFTHCGRHDSRREGGTALVGQERYVMGTPKAKFARSRRKETSEKLTAWRRRSFKGCLRRFIDGRGKPCSMRPLSTLRSPRHRALRVALPMSDLAAIVALRRVAQLPPMRHVRRALAHLKRCPTQLPDCSSSTL